MVRIKHRYLLVNILYPDEKKSPVNSASAAKDEIPYSVQFRQPSSDQLNPKFLARVIKDGVASLFGDYGSGKIAIKYFSPATSTMIIRVSRDHYRLVWTALTYMTRLPRPVDEACVMQVVRVSGTIRKAEEEAIRRARLSIRRAQQAAAYSRLGVAGAGETGAQYIDDDELAHDPLGTANGNGNMSEDEVEDDGSASED
nr:ribonuclease p/mrp protein subunit pop5 [Quercus suber]